MLILDRFLFQQEHPLSPVNQLILHSLISDDNAVGNDAEGLQVLKPW